jgi:hypothetical protein
MEYLPLLVYWGLQFAVALALVVGAAVVTARITTGRLLVWAGVLAAAAATIPQVAIASVLDRTLPAFRPDLMVGLSPSGSGCPSSARRCCWELWTGWLG